MARKSNGIFWRCRKCSAKYLPELRSEHYKKCPGRHPELLSRKTSAPKVGSDGSADSVHYGGADNPHETIKCLKAWGLEKDAFCWTAGKYISRAGKKEGATLLRDLEKANFYLGKRIERLKEELNAKT
jgi:hypothetical protein